MAASYCQSMTRIQVPGVCPLTTQSGHAGRANEHINRYFADCAEIAIMLSIFKDVRKASRARHYIVECM